MKSKTKDKLFEAWAYCDEHDKSTEFMLQYMADSAGVEYDIAVDFVVNCTSEQRNAWYHNRIAKETGVSVKGIQLISQAVNNTLLNTLDEEAEIYVDDATTQKAINKLHKYVKELEEKAWKYDELNK